MKLPVRILLALLCAAMVLAGLCAEGETLLRDSGHIRRGYEDLNGCLQLLGADLSYEGEKHGVFV